MKKLIFFTLVVLSFSSCSENKEYLTPESVVRANAEYLNLEDLDGAMSTIHPESAAFEQTEAIIKELFELYDLNYQIEKLEVLFEENDRAEVSFVQVTTKINGPEFRNNRLTGKHILKKYNNSWKIISTQTTNVDYLN